MLKVKCKPYETLVKEVKPKRRNEPEHAKRARQIIEAQKARERRSKQTPEEAKIRRLKDAQRAKTRRANLSAAQIAIQREKDAIKKRERRARETDAEKSTRRSLEAQKARDRRAKLLLQCKNNPTNRTGLSHFMELAERTDLLCNYNMRDPLGLPNENGICTDWIKQEVVDEEFTEVSQLCETALEGISREPRGTAVSSNLKSRPNNNTYYAQEAKPTCAQNNEGDKQTENESTDKTMHHVTNKDDETHKIKKSRSKKIPYKCDICNKLLSSKGNMRIHKMKKHGIKTPFKCQICEACFDVRRDCMRHRDEVHRRLSDGMFECDKCGKVAIVFHNFLTHLRIHSKPATSSKKLKAQAFICEHCGKVYKRPDGLKTHRLLIHLVDGGEKAANLKLQVQEKNYVCDTCGRRFAFRCLLKDHLNIHSGVKPYLCSVCGRAFAQRASMKQHAKTHGDIRPYQCSQCEHAFYSCGDLKKHMRKHTGERPYVCELCGESYAQSSHLIVHRRAHTGEKPFKCNFCGRGFTKSSDVIRHRRIHTGELPFLCQVCGKGFRQSAQCVNHIKNHHPDTILT